MAKVSVKWLGEGEDGPKSNQWGKYNFRRGEALEFDDEDPDQARLIEKARSNRFYEVSGGEPAPKPKVVVPPSQSSALGPVPKPGEPEASSVTQEPQPNVEKPPESPVPGATILKPPPKVNK